MLTSSSASAKRPVVIASLVVLLVACVVWVRTRNQPAVTQAGSEDDSVNPTARGFIHLRRLIHEDDTVPKQAANDCSHDYFSSEMLLDAPRRLQVRRLCEPYSPRTPAYVTPTHRCRALASDFLAVDVAQTFDAAANSAALSDDAAARLTQEISQCRFVEQESLRAFHRGKPRSQCALDAVARASLDEQADDKNTAATTTITTKASRAVVSLVLHGGSSQTIQPHVADSCRVMLRSFLRVAKSGDGFFLLVDHAVPLFQKLVLELIKDVDSNSRNAIHVVPIESGSWQISDDLKQVPSFQVRPLILHQFLRREFGRHGVLAGVQQLLFIDSLGTLFQSNPFDAFSETMAGSSFGSSLREGDREFVAAVADQSTLFDDIGLRRRMQAIVGWKQEWYIVHGAGPRVLPDGFLRPVVDANLLIGTPTAMIRFVAMWKEFMMCGNVPLRGADSLLESAAFNAAVHNGVAAMADRYNEHEIGVKRKQQPSMFSVFVIDPFVGPFRGRIESAEDFLIVERGADKSRVLVNCLGKEFAVVLHIGRSAIPALRGLFQ